MDLGKVWVYDPCFCWYFSWPSLAIIYLWFLKSSTDSSACWKSTTVTSQVPNPPVPPGSWCSTRAQEEMVFSKTYRIRDPQRTISGRITVCRLWIWNFSSALWAGWFGQVTPSKSITWWARGRASECGRHYTAWFFPFLPVDSGQVTSPRWKLPSVKWR